MERTSVSKEEVGNVRVHNVKKGNETTGTRVERNVFESQRSISKPSKTLESNLECDLWNKFLQNQIRNDRMQIVPWIGKQETDLRCHASEPDRMESCVSEDEDGKEEEKNGLSGGTEMSID